MSYCNETVVCLFNDINAHINEERNHRLAIILLLLTTDLTDEETRKIFDNYMRLTEE